MLHFREQTLDIRGMLPSCEPLSREKPFGDLLVNLLENESNSTQIITGAIQNGNEIIAVGLFFLSNNNLIKYMQGWTIKYSKWSPGMVLDLEMIKFALSTKIQAIDFGRGDEQYKFKFGANTHFLYNYILSPFNQ